MARRRAALDLRARCGSTAIWRARRRSPHSGDPTTTERKQRISDQVGLTTCLHGRGKSTPTATSPSAARPSCGRCSARRRITRDAPPILCTRTSPGFARGAVTKPQWSPWPIGSAASCSPCYATVPTSASLAPALSRVLSNARLPTSIGSGRNPPAACR